MKKIFFFTAITFFTLSSCRKEATTALDGQSPEIISNATTNSVNAVPINWDTTWYEPAGVSMFNSCTQEYINFTGSIHIHIRGVISDNKITWIGHYDVQNLKGVGQITGTRYVTTETFNFSNTSDFNTQSVVYNQRYSLHYISLGKESNFTLENDWHLTINANGEVAFFFSTDGDVIKCQ
jgi:hypothetical protein